MMSFINEMAYLVRGGIVIDKIAIGSNVYLDLHRDELIKGKYRVRLSRRQVHVLHRLSQELGKPVSSAELIKTIWGTERYVLSAKGELYGVIHRLREKIGGKETEGSHIVSISGYGYMLSPINIEE